MSAEYHLGTLNIFYSSRNLLEYLYGGLTRSGSFTFSFVNCVSYICILSELYFKEFCIVFSWVKSLG